ncbi:MAG: hypothetical protein HC884_19025 [Chloroflexaceae bacterium]|nr:hypothetical protein [Chloroflexaceae bacterium]
MLLWDGTLWPLVLAGTTPAGDEEYYREREWAGQDLRIRHKHDPASASGTYWEVTDTQQRTWRLGYTADSVWRYVAPSQSRHPWRWNLDRVEDIHTNYQTWHYTPEMGDWNGQSFERGGYLEEIAWNGNERLNQAPDHHVYVTLTDRRNDLPTDPATQRFFLRHAIQHLDVEGPGQPLWRYTFHYDEQPDGGTTRLLLRGLTQYGTDTTTPLNEVALTYQPPLQAGDGYRLGSIVRNGAPQLTYAYEPFTFHGTTLYRIATIRQASGSGGAEAVYTVRYGQPFGDPAGQTFWGFDRRILQDATPSGTASAAVVHPASTLVQADDPDGASHECRYRTEDGFEGLAYKCICRAPTAIPRNRRPVLAGGGWRCSRS